VVARRADAEWEANRLNSRNGRAGKAPYRTPSCVSLEVGEARQAGCAKMSPGDDVAQFPRSPVVPDVR
jgi:hypothetical protein